MIVGLIIIIIGIVFLLQNIGYISGGTWSIIWPAILIVIGLWIILKKRDHGFFWEERFGWKKKKLKNNPTNYEFLRIYEYKLFVADCLNL